MEKFLRKSGIRINNHGASNGAKLDLIFVDKFKNYEKVPFLLYFWVFWGLFLVGDTGLEPVTSSM